MTLYWLFLINTLYANEALPDQPDDARAELIVDLTDLNAARGVELRCSSGHRDAARFLFGRAVLQMPDEDCSLRFVGADVPEIDVPEIGPVTAGQLTCDLSNGRVECFSTCQVEER